ncbi:MAG: hypothetical protein GY926_20380 [bacterium]|nr:hypothetical protein [bacterium]
MNTEGVQGSWTDPDGDCIHTAYEINAAGQPACANDADCDDDGIQDGLDPDYDSGGGRLPSFAEQSIYFSD